MIYQCLLLLMPCVVLYGVITRATGRATIYVLCRISGKDDWGSPAERFCAFVSPIAVTMAMIHFLFITLIPYMATEGWATSALFTMFTVTIVSGIGMFIGSLWEDSLISLALDPIGVNKTLKQVFGLTVATFLAMTLLITIQLVFR